MNYVIVDGQNIAISVLRKLAGTFPEDITFFNSLARLLEEKINHLEGILKKTIVIDLLKFPRLEKSFLQLGWDVVHRSTGEEFNPHSDDFCFLAESLYAAAQPDCLKVILGTGDGELGRATIDYIYKMGKEPIIIAVDNSLSLMLRNRVNNCIILSDKDLTNHFISEHSIHSLLSSSDKRSEVNQNLLKVEQYIESIKKPVSSIFLGVYMISNQIHYQGQGNSNLKKWLSQSKNLQITPSESKQNEYFVSFVK